MKQVNSTQGHGHMAYHVKKVSAQWPSDYTGTQKAWVGVLRKMKLWNGKGYFGDKLITLDEWNVVLATAEQVSRETNKIV